MDQKNPAELPFPGVDAFQPPRPTTAGPAPASFPEIFQQHARFLWRTLMNLGVPSHEAQDLCQEVLIIVHRRLPEFAGTSLRGWLYGICARVASDYRRSARVRREILHGEVPEAGRLLHAADQHEQNAQRKHLMHALEGLEQEKRTALVLHDVEELTLAEVSEALGLPLQTVYSRIKSARQQLRRALEVDGHSEPGGAREAG